MLADPAPMTEPNDKTPGPTVYSPESQHDRRMKYGALVVFSTVAMILIAMMLTAMAQSHSARIDTTVGGTQSLRPQSLNTIRNLKEPVRIVALYAKFKRESHEQDTFTPVFDLLNEYATKGKGITTELIDPDTQKDEFNKLVDDVTNKYGGEAKDYKQLLANQKDHDAAIEAFIKAEVPKFRALPFDTIQDQNLQQDISAAYMSLVVIYNGNNGLLKQLSDAMDSDLNQQVPSYKDAIDDVKTTYTNLATLLGQFSQVMDIFKTNPAFPKDVKDYAPAAQARAAAVKKIVDDELDAINKLPPLKELDEFKTQLKSQSIIVMTDNGYKILQFDQLWKVPETSRFATESPDVQPQLAFAGEQQITAAIASLTGAPRPMVVFVRPGGPPVATETAPGQPPLFVALANRLKDYGFDVQEKDASGQSANQEEAPVPEPTPEQMKSAVWVVVRFPNDTQPGEPSPMESMLEDHLRTGGSAMVLLFPTTDAMDSALGQMGIRAHTDEVIVHEALPPPERKTNDLVATALQNSQLVFKLNQYGNHPIAQPLGGLDFLQAASVPVECEKDIPGVTATPLLPIPFSPHYWAAADAQSLLTTEHVHLTFNPRPDPENGRMSGDVDDTPSNPLYGAAAAEKTGGARLVVVGSYVFASSDLVDLPDNEMLENHGVTVARLPGNGEFFLNSIFWLGHQDSLLAISPHALELARIKDLTPQTQNFWRVYVLFIGLPLAVLAVGLAVYGHRRD